MKLLPTFPPGRVPLRSRYHPGFVEKLKVIPGTSWVAKEKFWWVPIEMANEIVALGAKYRAQPVLTMPRKQAAQNTLHFDWKLHDFQVPGVLKAIQNGSFILNWETGLGKTPAAIVAVVETRKWPCLVITPAAVRPHWTTKILEWAAGTKETDIFTVESAKDWDDYTGQRWVISSFELSTKGPHIVFGAVIIDELHYLKSSKSKRSMSLGIMLDTHLRDAFKLGLTATPMGNHPLDLHNQLDTLWPDRFGDIYKFRKRYCNAVENSYAASKFSYEGLNPLFAQELRGRLAHVSDRVVKSDVAHLLPAFTVEGLQYKPHDPAIAAAARKAFGATRAKRKDALNESIAIAFEEKAGIVLEQLAIEAENATHCCVLTFLKKSAKTLAAVIRKKFPDHEVYQIDGDMADTKARHALILEALKQPRAILVATMHSVGIGIDNLTHFQCAIFAELYYDPVVVIQALGRFSRLSGQSPSKCLMIIFRGTHDELIAANVLQKLSNANEVFKSSSSEAGLTKALGDNDTEEQFLDRLFAAAVSNAGD